MKKENTFKRIIVMVLTVSLLLTTIGQTVMAVSSQKTKDKQSIQFTKAMIEKELKSNQKQIQKDLEYSKKIQQRTSGVSVRSTYVEAAPAIIAVYAIPGIGEVAIAVTGAIIIGGITIAAGTWLYNKISAWFASNDKEVADQGKDKEQLKGKPGEVKVKGDKTTKIGKDGRAVKQRHDTDHGNPKNHTKPHDHTITWDKNGNPVFSRPINYPNGAPKF